MGKGKQREAEVLTACKHVLNFYRSRGHLTYRRIQTTGTPVTRAGRSYMAANPMKGMADILVFLHANYGAKTLHVELKSTVGKLSDSQTAWRDELAAIGHETYYEVKSSDALLSILELNGLPRFPVLAC